ncbi:hypothetical protein [Intrasporangium chromatireducens]|uniref:hypothetical protein n=1 Tax=Intrasporangium chromatireducens TaxID=1386088 RepID=UPI0012DBE472|nr:hypothetical protein [Intrasporangium chromatireducens]
MARKQRSAARRNATRQRPALSVATHPSNRYKPDPIESLLAQDDVVLADLAQAVTESLAAEIARARTALAAEMVLCEVFRLTGRDAPDDADEVERLDAQTALLHQVIEHAHAAGTTEHLALLRVCASLGPDATRAAAAQAADRLNRAGVTDRPWAPSLGRPSLLRAWHYGDIFGSQASVGALFDYRGREHLLMVLIDHGLGGGVKDCWVAEGRRTRQMRDEVAAKMAAEEDAFFEDIDAAALTQLLESALAQAPCPEQRDQIDDVAAYLHLTRSRAAHLAQLAGN